MKLPESYQVLMLRIRQNGSASGQDLRVTLENTKTEVRVNFSDFESLTNYLQQHVEKQAIS